jgi:hypothetical protein
MSGDSKEHSGDMVLEPLKESLEGGAIYGQGLHGRTIDAGRRSGDDQTLAAELAAAPTSPPWIAWTVPSPSSSVTSASSRTVRKVAATDAEARELVRQLSGGPDARDMVAKRFVDSPQSTAKSAFDYELLINQKVLAAYGPRDSARYTTLASKLTWGTERVVGLHVPATGAYYTISTRCSTPLDRMAFADRDVPVLVRDILNSFRRLHAGGLLHGDVKLDNMIHCGSRRISKSGSSPVAFRLIDWGATIRLKEDLPKVYLETLSPKNTASPMAWYAWGLGPVIDQTFLVMHTQLYPRTFFTSPSFAAFCASSLASFHRQLISLTAAERERGKKVTLERQVRTTIVHRHGRSFDLYNFGLALAHLAYTFGHAWAPATKTRTLALARRLTHYDHPEFVGDDAAAALTFFESGNQSQ